MTTSEPQRTGRGQRLLPWLVPLLISLALLTYIPAIGLWLPRTLGL